MTSEIARSLSDNTEMQISPACKNAAIRASLKAVGSGVVSLGAGIYGGIRIGKFIQKKRKGKLVLAVIGGVASGVAVDYAVGAALGFVTGIQKDIDAVKACVL